MGRVKLLRDEPVNVDKLGIHSKLLEVLKQIIGQISENSIGEKVKNVIGLFGAWGSGKSTIINLLKDKSKGYKVFVFDSWSHKDDFIKRAFLLKLAKFLGLEQEKYPPASENQNSDKKQTKITLEDFLTRRITDRTVETSPKIKMTWPLFLVLSILILSMLGFSFNSLIVDRTGKPITIVLAILYIIVLIILFCVFCKKKELFSQIISPFLSGTLDVLDTQLTAENLEFSNYDFQKLFNFIIKIYSKKRQAESLLVVLDNLDRVNNATILKFISLIQTIIEGLEKESSDETGSKTFTIVVPIDKKRIISIFKNLTKESDDNTFAKDFVEKIFPYSIEIPNIRQSNWKQYFRDKFREALEDLNIETFDMELIMRMFLRGIEKSKENLTPREIIHFLNQLAINYMYWEDKINIIHQAVYVAVAKYDTKYLEDLKPTNNIEENEIIKLILEYTNKSELMKNLLMQKFKTKRVYELIYKDNFEKTLEEGNLEKAEKIFKDIPDEESKKELINLSLEEIRPAMASDIRTLGNTALVMLKSEQFQAIKTFFKRRLRSALQTMLKSKNARFDTFDAIAGQGIGLLLKEISEPHLKNQIVNMITETLIKISQSTETEEEEDE